jgi:NAD(P)-dependent dehydrogenase (short-subunit alcohol dehydrogenase family)
MELGTGKVAVVTGAGSGIGLAMALAFAAKGLHVVIADVQDDALDAATAAIEARATGGAQVLAVRIDVSKEAEVQALAAATVERFGAVHVVCNNAGVSGKGDPWAGPIATWEWVMGVNFWGVVHGVRAFLPHLIASGGGHIVNTASMAGLLAGLSPSYDASKHAVVAMTENLFHSMTAAMMPVGVSCLCPGWVRTGIMSSERNWPAELGPLPETDPIAEFSMGYAKRAIDEGMAPAMVADLVLSSIEAGRFWVLPHQDWMEIAIERWHRIAEGVDPVPPEGIPGIPPRDQIIAEVMALLESMTPPDPAPEA